MSSFYTAAAWHQGKSGPPPIFASIGVRHQRCVELDAELRAQETLHGLLAIAEAELPRFDAGNVVVAVAQVPK
ncbi:unnamed protein product, partial [Prorocentrum cordatum]